MNYLKSHLKEISQKKKSPGQLDNELGNLYENLIKNVLLSEELWASFNRNEPCSSGHFEYLLFKRIMNCHNIKYVDNIRPVDVPRKDNGGLPKTDVCALVNGELYIKISSKRTHAKAVAVAEFDVKTIVEEVFSDAPSRLQELMLKFQSDASAKHFTSEEKEEMRELLSKNNSKNKLVRWALSGSPYPDSPDLRNINTIVTFGCDKEMLFDTPMRLSVSNVEDAVNKATSCDGGFGTGLSWTYATGTKGKKIQFKAKVTAPEVCYGA